MPTDSSSILLQLLIVVVAVIFGIWTGRAKAARMRELRDDLSEGRPRGYAILAIVAAVILWVVLT